MTLPLQYGAPITLEVAKRVMEAAEKEANANGLPMVIAIVDTGGHLIMLHRIDHAQNGTVDIARREAETAVNFKRPTREFEDAVAQGGMHLRMLAMGTLLPLEGGLPILRDGKVVGAIGVSGMQSTQDAQVARAGLAAL
jgi:glc operon protein GlcG